LQPKRKFESLAMIFDEAGMVCGCGTIRDEIGA
jgi:hypothetical protein